ncbi:conserved fungal protein [Sugiyamaella lignohabitans]|uniref:Conserved fungal protein n=1 Tax=Sugiyamaella lignohabitans TaxID=796027 RepID=A0A167E204_9ASCO|nr:uncharacterized protein AWJ20_1847 [Sugiyamaella lignohabitans]ANB13551.1 conserved fungal protein [Sugiyamaella lignohabitans]
MPGTTTALDATNSVSSGVPDGIEKKQNVDQSSSGLSKRALKRLQKEKAGNGEGDHTNVNGSSRESREESVTSDAGSGDIFVDHLQKRIRNLQKRKAKLDKYHEIAEEAKAKNLPLTLNPDQISALAQRETVEAPLKELQDALHLYKSQALERIAREKEQKAQHEAEVAKAVEAAKLEGIAQGREQLSLTVKFLRAASFKRQLSDSTPAEESAAFEHLLKVVYAGDDTSLSALDDLVNGSSKQVFEEANSITFEKVKEISQIPPEEFFLTQTEEVEEPKVETTAAEKSQPTISFLQEEVTEEPQQPIQDNTASLPANKDTAVVESAPTSTPTANGSTHPTDRPPSANEANPKSKKKNRPYYRNKRKANKDGENKATPPPASNSA